jgi:rare lipoprotein A (peptidoglycan hydrolase)
MRRITVVATAALIAALALAGLPVPAGSKTPSEPREVQLAAFTSVKLETVDAPPTGTAGGLDAALRSAGFLASDAQFAEPGSAPTGPTSRPTVAQPAGSSGAVWKPPRYTLSGVASYYGNGTTAMRLPYGTVIRICGARGCIVRTVTDYGPSIDTRIIDLYRPDFFAICGCAWYSGLTSVTVGVY